MILRIAAAMAFLMLIACGKVDEKTADDVPAALDNVETNKDAAKAIEPLTETERLTQWLNEKYADELQFSPLLMTFQGKKDRYDEIDSMTDAAVLEQLAWRKGTVEELESTFDYEKLSEDAKISYDLWMYQYAREKAAADFIGNTYVFHQMNGVQSFLPQFMINFHKVSELSDMEAYIKRIDGIGRAMYELIEKAKQYAAKGVRPPKFAYDEVIEQANNIITGQPFEETTEDSPLWADVNSKLAQLLKDNKVSEVQAENLRLEAKQALLGAFQRSYQDLIEWMESDIKKTDLIATGVGKRDGGLEYYNHMLKVSTTTDLNAEQIHELGLAEVERLTQEMEALKNSVGFEGTLQEFFTFTKEDDQFFYPNTDEGRLGYISDTETYLGNIDKRLPDFFGVLPKAALVVKRVEAFREQDGAAQHYFPGTPDGTRPGIYYAHLSDMRSMPKNEMEAIAYHEGNPGHHMQISIAQELDSVPEFRKQLRFTVYSEGWALYSELLAKEMGAYTNPYSDFGRLITEMWRAVRLVVDTGLHAKGWTESEATEYFRAKAPVADGAVTSEIRRYIVLPGQATSYKIGMMKIQEMRSKAEKALGEKFDIRGFHDTILGGGALPLAMLEEKVQSWVDRTSNAGS